MNHPLSAPLTTACAAALTATLFAAAPALAQNKGGGGSTSAAGGVITIDQARAEAGGVTAGDAPGFPVTLSQPGSYRLMGNLTVADPTLNAIEITSANVTLDLNGFSIQGPVSCYGSGGGLTCSSDNVAGTRGSGIHIMANAGGTTVGVHGPGAVAGFSGYGVYSPGTYTFDVHRLRVWGNGMSGIANAGAVTDSSITRNRIYGVNTALRVSGSTLASNRFSGVFGAFVRHNVSTANGQADQGVSLFD